MSDKPTFTCRLCHSVSVEFYRIDITIFNVNYNKQFNASFVMVDLLALTGKLSARIGIEKAVHLYSKYRYHTV